jgi:hypothetical protein
MRTYHPHVERKGRVFQIVYRWWGLGHVMESAWEIGEDGKPKQHRRPSAYGLQALKVARHVARCHRKTGVITYKALAPLFYEDFGKENVQWFGNLRGSNKLEGCDGLAIIGQNTPASRDTIDISAMLNPGRMRPFRAIDDDGLTVQPWGPVEMDYWLTDEGREIARRVHGEDLPSRNVGGFEDDDLWTVFEQICVAELTQAIHRNRILLHEDHVVWVFSPMPLLDTAVDWIADDPPLIPERWIAGKFERENPIPFDRWLDLEAWGIYDKNLAYTEYEVDDVQYHSIANGAGVTEKHAKNKKWIKRLVEAYPDLFEPMSIRTGGRGRPAYGAKSR